MKKKTSLGSVLFTKTQRRVLGLLFGNPGRMIKFEDMNHRTCLVSGLVAFFFVATACAELNERGEWAAAVGFGKSKDGTLIFRSAIQYEFPRQWFENRTGRLTGFHEASAGFWNRSDDSLGTLTYSPVFTYRIAGSRYFEPYLEGGIGLGFLSERRINGRNMSSHFQFEDRIGIGVRFGRDRRHDLNYRYMHYSNAGFTKPNNGIDIYMVSYSLSL